MNYIKLLYPDLYKHKDKFDKIKSLVGSDALYNGIEMWNSVERYYHNLQHLYELFELYDQSDLSDFTNIEKDILIFAIFYHDIYYNPKEKTNETKSCEIWLKDLSNINIQSDEHLKYIDEIKNNVLNIIEATKDHSKQVNSKLINLFIKWDLTGLTSSDLNVLIKAERRILKEFQFFDYELYRIERINFLNNIKKFILEINPDSKIEALIQYVEARKLKIGIYAGSFNPIHIGHYSIIKKAEKIFDKVIIACGNNPMKNNLRNNNIFEEISSNILPYHQVEYYDGLLTQYVQSKRSDYVEPSVIKGLGRDGDFENEKMQLRYMEDMDQSINVAYFISDRKFDYISSTGANIIKNIRPDLYDKYTLGNWPDAEKKMNN